MGCTSSAQNTAPSLANSNSDKDQNMLEEIDEIPMKEEKEKRVAQEKGSQSNGIKVLPTCDILDENTRLDSHSKLVDTANPDPDSEKDSHANGLIKESGNEYIQTNNLATETCDSEDRLSHLEEVVEKVVELYENGELEITTETELTNNEEIQSKITQRDHDNTEKEQEENKINKTEEMEAEEAASPSQSQCSRATRWEALADIAAELPPSLAVDPLTGQIYALSK